MSGTHDDDSIRPTVERWINEREQMLESLFAQRRGLDAEIARIRRSLVDVTPFAQSLGIEVKSQPQSATLTTGVRRGARSLPRRSEFARVSMADAVESIFAEQPSSGLHANYFIERIFDVQSDADFRSARSSIVPVLSAGVRDEKWERVAPNTFKRRMPEGEPAVVNDLAPP